MHASSTKTRRLRQKVLFAALSLSVICIFLFNAIDVHAFIISHPHNANHHHRNSRAVLYETAVESPAIKEDVDVVGEGRRGDAKGAALRLVDVAVSRGGTTLLSNIDWRVEPKSKWGLVGANGCGKSTLLKAILNDLGDYDKNDALNDFLDVDGDITIGTKQQVGYLKQTAVSGSTLTVFDEAASAMKEVATARANLKAAEEKVETSLPDDLDQNLKALDLARERYEMVGGYGQEQEVASLLKGLGFTNLTQTCDELSGGWQMRVSFAKLLLSKPSLALLDEPSNHLDRSARAWLANYLKTYDAGAMVLVTHDVELLNACEHIAEITSGGSLQMYKSCTYDQYLQQKRDRAYAAAAEYEKNMEKAAKLQAFVDKFGASATKASAAQSRVKQIEKMRAQGLLDPPTDTGITEIQRFKPRLKLPPPPPPQGGALQGENDDDGVLLSLRNGAAVGYTKDESNEAVQLITDIEFDIQQGMKILIRGPNGAGKTTLLDTLRGKLPLLGGDRFEDTNLKLGIFTQDLAQELDPTRRAVDLVTEHARSGSDGDLYISDEDARGVLGGLGLQGEKALRLVGQLSGGEKARVALAMFALKPSNLYLLDEVSNHLDVECVEALSEVLSDWGDGKGSIIVISHDKAFCEQVGFTHILTITSEGTLKLEQRDARASDWDSSIATFQKSMGMNGDDDASDGGEESSVGVVDKELDAKRRKMAFNAPKRISKIESLVEQKEEKIAVLDEEMLANGSDVGKLVDLSKKKEILEEEVMALMEEWEELETLVAEMS
jgi:ATP-binding cassette subfamily F protein 3